MEATALNEERMMTDSRHAGPFEATFASLRTFQCPEWFKDAKLGFWSHWGPQSVPMYGDWYARAMYCQGSEQYKYHVRHYGHPSRFGYKDLLPLWKAERFDPDALMDLYVQAGARYFVSQAMHHDNFFNYNSRLHRWNSVAMGPHKDIVGLWKSAATRKGLPFGVSEHLGASFAWWAVNKGCDNDGPHAGVPYDGNDPAFEDFYLPNAEHYRPDEKLVYYIPYTTNVLWQRRWLEIMKELIDSYEPDLLYCDGVLPFGDNEAGIDPSHPVPSDLDRVCAIGLQVPAYLYNRSASKHQGKNRAVFTQKDRRAEIFPVGVLDLERTRDSGMRSDPWQSCDCLGGWFYDVRQTYKRPGQLIDSFVDIISKNGNLLLNIPQRPDGTLDDECRYVVEELARWNAVCSEGVYGTRPFRVFGEGKSERGERKNPQTLEAPEWTSSDFRFTTRAKNLYAFQMRWPEENTAVIRVLTHAEKVKSVRLLGSESIPFQQVSGKLVVALPRSRPTAYVNCLAIELT